MLYPTVYSDALNLAVTNTNGDQTASDCQYALVCTISAFMTSHHPPRRDTRPDLPRRTATT